MGSVVQPNEWVAFKLPTGAVKVIQVIPNTTISIGKYGSFPSNLVIHRPYHLTYEIQAKREGENFSTLRVVSAQELQEDILGDVKPGEDLGAEDGATADEGTPADVDDEQMALDSASQAVGDAVAKAETDPSVRQTLTSKEIEELKKKGAAAGKDVIAKLLASHTALDEKTAFSLEKYKLLKTRKYIRRFEVMPLDTPLLADWLLEEKDGSRILEMRQEMIALLGCWANVHCAVDEPEALGPEKTRFPESLKAPDLTGGRWLVVDDTGGLLVSAMAERMGILHPKRIAKKPEQRKGPRTVLPVHKPTVESEVKAEEETDANMATNAAAGNDTKPEQGDNAAPSEGANATPPQPTTTESGPDAPRPKSEKPRSRHYDRDDLDIPFAGTNTLTLLHSNSQPNLSFLRYYDFDFANPNPPFASHPLHRHLTWLSWLQLLHPEEDPIYAHEPRAIAPAELQAMKGNRRGVHHRKRRRWARTRFVVDSARAGGFSGLVCASTLDPVSLLRTALPLLALGAPIAIYSPTIEPLAQLSDALSVARRAAWVTDPPPGTEGLSREELERWPGSDDFPINPSLVLGPMVQTSRVRKWQVLPGRTHPLMTGRGGSEGYVFTAWKALPAEGRVEARGRHKKRKVEVSTPATTGS